MLHIRHIIIAVCISAATAAYAQKADIARLGRDVHVEVESTTTLGSGNYAPLWLSSNRYGLSSTENKWNYERVALFRNINADSNRNWRLGYGVNAAVMFGGESTFHLQELYVEAAWKRLYATIGSKQHPLELKNSQLSSGGFIYGINSRPIPQIHIGVDYFNIPLTKGWWQWRGHVSYGWKTDANWQKAHIKEYGLLDCPTVLGKHTKGTLYHEKALYWKFGKKQVFPLEFEIGMQWATEFGGTAYSFSARNFPLNSTINGIKLPSGLDAYWHALLPGGSGAGDGDRPNKEGNHIGSWILALTYDHNGWYARAYAERLFEDYSQLGTRFGISDHLFGLELGFPSNPYITSLVFEHMNTRDQSGPIFHDITSTIPDQMDGRDNYYNHGYYTGYQHYGMSMGHPLITSPLYNHTGLGSAGHIYFYNNRVEAWHAAISGNPISGLNWRFLMTFTTNWGTYYQPFEDPTTQTYIMLDAGYSPESWKGWSGRLAIGIDHGKMLGNNTGVQFSILKQFRL